MMDSYEMPWNPYRRTPMAKYSSGSGSQVATSGMVRWKYVSSTAKLGMPGKSRSASRMMYTPMGVCSGASPA